MHTYNTHTSARWNTLQLEKALENPLKPSGIRQDLCYTSCSGLYKGKHGEAHACQGMCGGQRTACRSQFSSPTMWVLETDTSSLVTSTLATSLAQVIFFLTWALNAVNVSLRTLLLYSVAFNIVRVIRDNCWCPQHNRGMSD